jgi:hypothetical protein
MALFNKLCKILTPNEQKA